MIVLASALTLNAYGQSESGKVVGTVTDQTGAEIPQATLTLTNVANGLVLSTVTNGSGELNLPGVPRGDYTAKITAPGFESQTQNITVTVTQVQTLLFKLAPGSVSDTVTVSSAAALVNTTNATLGETIGSKQIEQLPLNGRNSLNLALLAPGVTQGANVEYGQDTVNRFSDSGGGAISVNGTRAQANNFILDGVDNNDGLQNIILFFPPVDATQEFKISTSVAPAQYGRAGGVIQVASIKSGTNQIHGSAFEFYRSGKWAANPNYRFLGADATPTPPYRHEQFGGSAGGPIMKNKLFLFGDYQGTRIGSPDGTHFDTVPTAAMRKGDFSELLTTGLSTGDYTYFPICVPGSGSLNSNIAQTSKGQIYDPQTCTPIAGNIIPANRLNPAAVNYLNAFPMPTRTDRLLNNYFVNNSSTSNYNTFDARLDWNPSASDLLFLRFSYDNSTSNNQSELPQQPNYPLLSANGSKNYTHARGYALGYTHTFSPTLVNDARIAYNRDNYGYQPGNFGSDVGGQLGIQNTNLGVANSGGPLIGGNGSEIEYTGDYGLFAVPQNTYEVTDTLTINRGKHSLNVGGTWLRRQVSYFRPICGKGCFFIGGNGSDFTGYEVSELLVGGFDNYGIGTQTGFFGEISQEDALFANDDWRVTPRLTLNLGARWDFLQWPVEMHDRQAAFDVKTGTVLLAGQNGVPRSIIKPTYTDFAPRVGFAYDLHGDGKSSLHGGYGIYYFPDYGGISNQLGQQIPYGGDGTYFAFSGHCLTFTGQTAQGAPYTCPGYTSGTSPNVSLPLPGYPNFNPASPPYGMSGLAVDQDNRHSRQQQWNLQLEQQIGPRDVVRIAYVGAHADHLSTYYSYNTYAIGSTTKPFPNLGGISLNRYDGHSNYNGLQLHAEHRGTNFTATASYAWSHALDDSASAFGGTPVTLLLYYNQPSNYGNSIFDERHIFSSSFVYNLPFGRGQMFGGHSSRAMDLLIGGWQLNNIVLLSTGQPVDLSAAGSSAPGNRPDLTAPIKYPKSIGGYWFDPSSFSSNIPVTTATDGTGTSIFTRIGTLARNQVYGPGFRSVNLGVQKNLHISEGKQLELHGDAFNVLNTANFSNPNNSLGNPSLFGKITGLHGEVRQIQIAARLVF
ncbi:MAG: TonB-dependent receptor [Edaphobacter sp.]|uniref:TonB-dependent receptor n=1 Tax=Edaphobacter sp. TaxID=1934404 RepID=UPI002385E437|nr:carboxypeptidase regulatory-like domain-containing protein [Edaphobacter sp.]MDE1176379.1 TonB-dependent receptor [Edaphobacter sp.]